MVRDLKSLGPNLQKIVKRLMDNQNLLKLLYYTDKDPLSHEDLTDEQKRKEVYEKLIKVVPRVGPKETAQSLISLRVVRGSKNAENTEFRDFLIQIEVFVPLTQWFIKSDDLRPFAIMSEIQQTLNNKIISGLGRMTGGDFQINFLTEEISCYETSYWIVDYE